MRGYEKTLVKILVCVISPAVLLAEVTPNNGGRFRILASEGFVAQPVLERDAAKAIDTTSIERPGKEDR